MKRLLLIGIVSAAVAWILYSSYELWINKDNTVQPEYVFCQDDEAILLINRFQEAKDAQYLDMVKANPIAGNIPAVYSVLEGEFKVYISSNRTIIIIEKENKWTESEINNVKSAFKLNELNFKQMGPFMMVSKDYTLCENHLPEGLLREGDKKASANFWVNLGDQWKRTDVYNLSKGMFEYRSSEPRNIYGESVQDIPMFSPQIPISSSSYFFQEKFYAQANDSIFKNGPMSAWVDKGFVTINYSGHPVIISDYRTQQVPSLILIEQTKIEDSIRMIEDIYSFVGFQLTKDFPSHKNKRFYSFEIEDKVLFTEDESTARRIQVDYQLGKTLALSPERQEQFFSGLPSHVNMRAISEDKKTSLTWKNKLSFEVSTQPPSHQITEEDKNTWSVSAGHSTHKLVPISDHLRNGTSILSYSNTGEYELYSPNGNQIWKGKIGAPIEGKVEIIDLFDNNKKQFLFHTKNEIHLIDLNGNKVGDFPYRSDHELTSRTSIFEWNNTKRLLTGNEKGEVVMLNSNGQELNIIQVGQHPIISTPYALNVKGNLRAWTLNNDFYQFLGYLENPAKPSRMSRIETNHSTKHKGKIVSYFEREGKIYRQEYEARTDKGHEPTLVDNGKIYSMQEDHLIINENNLFKIYNHDGEILHTQQLPFNEVGNFVFLPERKISVVMDYLHNKIHAYNQTGEEIEGFPKEGRNTVEAHYNEYDKTLYTFTLISESIICYKTKF